LTDNDEKSANLPDCYRTQQTSAFFLKKFDINKFGIIIPNMETKIISALFAGIKKPLRPLARILMNRDG
jgi:hypothetical protein